MPWLQWLELCTSTAEGKDSIPGWGTEIPHATPWDQKKKEKLKKILNGFLWMEYSLSKLYIAILYTFNV